MNAKEVLERALEEVAVDTYDHANNCAVLESAAHQALAALSAPVEAEGVGSKLEPIRVGELRIPTDFELAVSAARTAVDILTTDPTRIGSATWRLADALLLLSKAEEDLPGIHYPSGRGARLSLPGAQGEAGEVLRPEQTGEPRHD